MATFCAGIQFAKESQAHLGFLGLFLTLTVNSFHRVKYQAASEPTLMASWKNPQGDKHLLMAHQPRGILESCLTVTETVAWDLVSAVSCCSGIPESLEFLCAVLT